MGAPNAGKSTLTNALVGSKVSIVTQKAQTTRRRVLGIACVEQTQIIFVDTPGLFVPRKVFEKSMVDAAVVGLLDADLGLILIDVARTDFSTAKTLISLLPARRPPLCLILNKIDLIDKTELLAMSAALNELTSFEQTFMVSALKGSGIPQLQSYLAKTLPEGPWHYPEDQISNLTDRELAAEIVREKIFLYLHEELPYGMTVDAESWEAFRNGSVKITLAVYLEREQHKPIILGAGGQKIKHIGKLAREELEALWGHPVHLFLHVKVKEKWTEKPALYADLGVQFGE